jgi:hypothetical protein
MVGNAPEWAVIIGGQQPGDRPIGYGTPVAADGASYILEEICQVSGGFHNRGTWSDTKPIADYSCDYRGNSHAPLPDAFAAFRVCGPC